MVSPYYVPTGSPLTGSQGASATIRAEFAAIAAGFGVLPQTLTANKALVINAGGTAIGLSTGSLTLNGNIVVATGKTVTLSNTLTFTGTDGSSVNFGAGGTVLYNGGAGFVASISGTANEITASAATGAVTLSLPAALTFTGKTVTGGTFASPTISGTVAGAHSYSGALTFSAAITYGGVTLANSVTGTGSMVLSASPIFTGAPSLTQAVNSSLVFQVTNTDTGAAARADIRLVNATHQSQVVMSGTGWTPAGVFLADQTWLFGNGANGILICTGASAPINFAVSNNTVGNWTSSALTVSTALNYGGVTLSNSVTGTGSMVLSASPILTGTLTAAAANFSGNVFCATGAWVPYNQVFGFGAVNSFNDYILSPTGGNDVRIVAGGVAGVKVTTFLVTFGNPIQLANAYVATPQVSTGYVTLRDSTGTTYKVLVST